MKFISLFAGVGGFDLALERLGHECVYANEWDKYCKQIYDKHFCANAQPFPTIIEKEEWRDRASNKDGSVSVLSGHEKYASDRNYNYKQYGLDTRDITTVTTDEIPDHDLLCGGFPCQSFSIAGKRGGFADTRGTMFFEIARILRAKQPRLFILENVKGLLSHDNGATFKTIITTLAELGYDCQWQVLNSKNFGVPQNRERVFIVGHLRGTPRPEVFPFTGTDRESSSENKSTALDANYGKGLDNHGQRTAIIMYPHGTNPGGVKKLPNLRASSGAIHNELLAVGTLRTHKDGEGFREVKSGLAPTIPARAREDGSGQGVVMLTERRTEEAKAIRREMLKQGKDWSPRRGKELVPRDDDASNTITASQSKEHYITDGISIRRLTPIECERLQGFPDGWTEGVSDTQRYKMMGNAVTVNVVYEIAKLLFE